MHLIKLPDEVREQVAVLPSTALAAFADVIVLLEEAPWGGVGAAPAQPRTA